MNSVCVYVGLDYHQSWVQVCILDAQGGVLCNRRCDNDATALQSLVQRYGDRPYVAIEACTGAANLAEELLAHSNWSVHLAHAGYVARMKQNPDKTDYSDARMLADLERVGYLPQVWLAPEPIRELRQLVRYRQQLVKERRATKLRIRALLREQRVSFPQARAWSLPWQEWLSKTDEVSEQGRWILERQRQRLEQLADSIHEVEQRLEAVTAGDEVVQRLRAQKGIGLITAVMLRAEVGRFDRFRNGRQLSRFCGLSPHNASSGERQATAGLIKAGNPQLRSVLIEAAHRLIRYESRWQDLAARLRQGGKCGSVVAAAVANRWVRRLYHEMVQEVPQN